MTVVRQLLAELGLDTDPFKRGISSAEGLASGFNRTLSNMSVLGGNILYGALGLAATGATALGATFFTAAQNASQAQDVEAQLNAVLASTQGIAGVTADEVQNLASELAGLTKFEDEAIISGQNILLTFTNLSDRVFPQATETMLDMSQALGQDLQSSAIQLGKALQDPIEGANALRRVGVNLDDATQKHIKTLVEQGNLYEAQLIILKELQTEFGGSAKAAGQTLSGQLTILKNTWGDLLEEALKPTLPILVDLAKTLNEHLAKPETIQFVQMLATALANFISSMVARLPALFTWIQNTFGWFQQNQGVIVGALTALGVAVGAFIWTVAIPGAIAFISAWWPVILIMGLAALAGYLLYEAWKNNFLGIQLVTKRLMGFILDAFFRLRAYLAIYIPEAIEAFKTFWNDRLLPILQKGAEWIGEHLIPLVRELSTLFTTVFRIGVTVAAGILQRYLIPSLERVGLFLRNVLFPVIFDIGKFLAVQFVISIINVGKAIDWLVARIAWLNERLNELTIPWWLTPGSPTPLETGVLGVVSAMKKLDTLKMPMFTESSPALAGSEQGVTRTINLQVNAKDFTFKQVVELVNQRDEALLSAIAGAIA